MPDGAYHFIQALTAMTSTAAICISKLDAARRQLEVAIRLYFSADDPVSIHTLSSAAFAILSDVSRKLDIEVRHFRSELMSRAKPGHEKEMAFYLKRHENFFKHGNHDHTENIEFNPTATEWVLFDAIMIYSTLTKESTPLMKTFNVWWQYTYRDLLRPEFQEDRARFDEFHGHFETRAKFFSLTLPLLSKSHGT